MIKNIRYLVPQTLRLILKKVYPIAAWIGIILLLLGSYWVATLKPDHEQGEIFKMLYVHVPASWWALGIYALMTGCAVLGFITRMPQFHLMAKYWSVPGIIYTIISLITGMIWGKYTWGTYWVWDARLTTMFIQFIIYMSYIFLVFKNYTHDEKIYATGSLMVIIGFINLPFIKYSVDWWFTLHQPASLTLLKCALHASYLWPLLVNACAFFLIALSVFSYLLHRHLEHSKTKFS
ncbi:MAG: Heme exporter protein C [Holosporales bacterium]